MQTKTTINTQPVRLLVQGFFLIFFFLNTILLYYPVILDLVRLLSSMPGPLPQLFNEQISLCACGFLSPSVHFFCQVRPWFLLRKQLTFTFPCTQKSIFFTRSQITHPPLFYSVFVCKVIAMFVFSCICHRASFPADMVHAMRAASVLYSNRQLKQQRDLPSLMAFFHAVHNFF